MKRVEDEYFDILQNIESAIIQEYRKDENLMDADVLKAVKALTFHYHAEKRQHRPTTDHLSGEVKRLFVAVKEVCEWRLGRGGAPIQPAWPGQDPDLDAEPVTVPEIQICLKHVQKSICFWNKEGGPRNYLDFVSQFLP